MHQSGEKIGWRAASAKALTIEGLGSARPSVGYGS